MSGGTDGEAGREDVVRTILAAIEAVLRDRIGPRPAGGAAGGGRVCTTAYARAIVDKRAKIGMFLDARLFADPAFDILLDLFACEGERRRRSVSDCAHAARIPGTTALRWVALLQRRGLVLRRDDPDDARRTFVVLTDRGRTAIGCYLDRISAAPLAIL